MVLVGSSLVVTFVLQPSQEESYVASAGLPQSCHGMSLQSIKNDLLKSLNLQAEPQVPQGLVDNIREQWKQAFSALSHQPHGAEEAHSASVSDGGNSNSLKCCSFTSEVFMKDLSWSNWVIYPLSLTMTYCKLCTGAGNTVQCPHTPLPIAQVPCCHSTSQKMVPIVYIDDYGSVVISSLQLTQGCGCASDNSQRPINK